jgi:RNA polymerase sigma-70 factor (ECF subfamily)
MVAAFAYPLPEAGSSPADPLAPVAYAIAAGDDRQVTVMVRATQARLLRTATRILRDADGAEDVVVTAYTRAIFAIREGKFRFDAPLLVWLDRIVTLGALDALRARKRSATGRGVEDADETLADEAPSPEEVATARHQVRKVAEIVAALPARQRDALLLTEVEGLSTAEASDKLGCSRGALELLLVRARRTLRERIARAT